MKLVFSFPQGDKWTLRGFVGRAYGSRSRTKDRFFDSWYVTQRWYYLGFRSCRSIRSL